jgi:hypothetical protein
MSLESELREALRRKEPPDGFTDRVMNAIASPPVVRTGRRWSGAALAAAAMLAIFITGLTAHHIEQRREGERAKAQLMLALRITSKKLHETQQHLQR